jgi:3-oxoacyl-[acyl-carrier-protein] synthase II
MASSSRRAVLTGVGVVSPLGCDLATYWDRLRAGHSGVCPIPLFDPSGLPVRIAGVVPDFDAKSFFDKKDKQAGKNLKIMTRSIKVAVAAAQVAMADAKLDKDKVDPTRFGVDFGAGLIATELNELGPAAAASANGRPGFVDLGKWGSEGLAALTPLWMLKYLPNMIACHVSILHNAQGPSNTIIANDVASLLAMGEAYRAIMRNQADLFLTGGGDSKINPLAMVRQCLFQPLSRRNDEPQRASRPFDKNRDGMVLGEGGGVFLMEEAEHARTRGATPYAEVVGFGSAFDRRRDGTGLARAIRTALTEAGIGPGDIDHVNAQGVSTTNDDIREARALVEIFGPQGVPVLAIKGAIGNLGAAANAVELAASVLALRHGQVPPTLNYETPDPACPLAVVTSVRPVTKPYVLKIGFTDLGQSAALVVRRVSTSSLN